ncbi:hypothetical protein BZG35_08375 [Brevundimonas sp. LM2]|nr:hypothetical protein BZG35_08375 [Brevundimonas sp. LM2]
MPTTPSALTTVYLRRRDALAAFIRRRTGCDQAAQDLTQEVWVRVAALGDQAAPVNPEAFLQRIAGNLALDWLRRRRFRSAFVASDVDPALAADPAPEADRALHARRAVDYLAEVIDELPPKRRQAFLLYRGHGMTMKQVAAQLGISEKTVEHQVAKALVHCRHRLAEAGLWP